MAPRPRVFFVLGSLAPSDWGEEVVSILGRLSRSRVEPRVISLGGSEDLRERIAGMKVRVYPLGLSVPLGVLLAVPRVRRMLKQMEADVVHGFGSWGGSVATLAAPDRTAVVRSVAGPPERGRGLEGLALRWLERRAARRNGVRYLVREEADRRLVAEHYGGGETTVLPTSVDVAGTRRCVEELGREGGRRRLGIGEEELVVACVGGFHSEAVVDEILQGVAVVRRERSDVRFFLVGGGRFEASSRWRAEELQLDDGVVFLGSGASSCAIWAAADLVVDAEPFEGWSRSALVAQAAGLPVVKRVEGVVDGGLHPEAARPKVSGRADWFASDLVRLAGDPDLRRRVAMSSRAHVAGHDVARVAETLGRLYQTQARGL